MAVIYDVPVEIIFAIFRLLGIEDAFMLSLSCRYFEVVLRENSICRQLLVAHAPYSAECLEAKQSGKYAQALRKLAKRRQAVSAPEPFSAAVVAVADSHIYADGMLLYIVERSLRGLTLRGTVDHEVVVDIRSLLNHSIPESKSTTKYKFTLLHHASGLVSCRYTHCRQVNESWLVVFHIREGWAASCRLDTTYKLFVRNDKDFLYFGTHTGHGADGYRRWVLQGFSVHQRKFFNRNTYLDDLIGSDIGNNVFFDVIDGYFYALSNQTSYVVNDVKSSYFYCLRFPMGQPAKIEVARKASLWRRKNTEGPIDDRFTFLKLEKSEVNNALVVIESRREWRPGSSSSKRTYYMQEVVFDKCEAAQTAALPAALGTLGTAAPDYAISAASTNASPDNDSDNQGNRQQQRMDGVTQGQMRSSLVAPSAVGSLPMCRNGEPHRTAQHVHPGDDGSKMVLFTFSSTPIQTYHVSCATFLDVVNNPTAEEPETQRLMLRAGCRTPRHPVPSTSNCPTCRQPLLSYDNVHHCQTTSATAIPSAIIESAAMFGVEGYEDPLYPQSEIDRLFYDKEVMTWPTRPGDKGCHSIEDEAALLAGHWGAKGPRYEELDGILNPPNHHGHVMGTWDGHSVVYSSGGGEGSMQAIVFLSFDSSICLPGLKSWWHGRPTNAPEAASGENKANGQERPQQQALPQVYNGPHGSLNRGGAVTTSMGESLFCSQVCHGRPPGKPRQPLAGPLVVGQDDPVARTASDQAKDETKDTPGEGEQHKEAALPGVFGEDRRQQGAKEEEGNTTTEAIVAPWIRYEKPMYHSINSGIEFSFSR